MREYIGSLNRTKISVGADLCVCPEAMGLPRPGQTHRSASMWYHLILGLLNLALLLLMLAPHGYAQRKPNVLFITGDDHAAYVLGAYGNRLARTPNLDKLAARGVRFNHAYPNSPVCTPSRATIITGKYPHAAGVTLLATPLPDEQVTIAEQLKSFGYRTGAIGKMHFNSNLQHGFDYRIDRPDHRRYLREKPARAVPAEVRVKPQWRPFRDPARIWLNAEALPVGQYDEDAEGSFFARKAIEFMAEESTQPFCLWLSFYEPHSPYDFPLEWAGTFDPKQMPVGKLGPEDGRQIPKVFADLTEAEKPGIVAAYYSSVAYLDKNVGLALDALQRLKLDEQTLVIYIGDHGYNLGHHGRFEKHSFWESAVRAPLLVSYPQRFGRGKVNEALVEFVDLVPTILDVCGVPHTAGLQGKSLLPLLTGKAKKVRDYVFSEYLFGWEEAMIRSAAWKFIYTKGDIERTDGYETASPKPGKSRRLYDLKRDPDELTNLATRPEYQKIVRALERKLYERLVNTQPPSRPVPKGLTQAETIDFLLRPIEGKQATAP
jgi:choline-sulfatase